MEGDGKGPVCVTGGTGYVASWLIKRLLEEGYSVHATVRDMKKDLSYLTSLPGASTRLKLFNADLDNPESFRASINGCNGVFHLAHPMDFEGKESEDVKIKRAVKSTIGILQICVDSKTVMRVVYTSSAGCIAFNGEDLEVADEECWSDVDYIRANFSMVAPYFISKILSEKAALDFAEKNGLDLVTVAPSYIHGPFINPKCPDSVSIAMATVFGHQYLYPLLVKMGLVHVDDVASTHIHLYEHPDAKGRYICSSLVTTINNISEFLLARYPEFKIPTKEELEEIKGSNGPKGSNISSQKLLDTGFKFKYGLEEMYDGAIRCCKERGLL